MTDQFDKAQELEQQFRDSAINHQLNSNHKETPDEDENGTRFCLDCGVEIPTDRLEVESSAVRCVCCQSKKEL